MSEVILLGKSEIEDAQRLASISYPIYAGNQDAPHENTQDKHCTGRWGELALEKHYRNNGFEVDSYFRENLDSHCDLRLRAGQIQRIEVKTFGSPFWHRCGRCVAVVQMERVTAKADVVIWCKAYKRSATQVEVEIMGYNTVAEVAATSPRRTKCGRHECLNYQVNQRDVRELDERIGFVFRPPTPIEIPG
ncbi:MAG: hypothetical protein ACYCSN_02930 [Acidobacteriaceae bacterium]